MYYMVQVATHIADTIPLLVLLGLKVNTEYMTFAEVAKRLSTHDKRISAQAVYMWTYRGVYGRGKARRSRPIKLKTTCMPSGLRVSHSALAKFLSDLQPGMAVVKSHDTIDTNPLDQVEG
jgi:hypothetical protein